jgi:hypothetical protein
MNLHPARSASAGSTSSSSTVTAVRGPDDIEFQLADGHVFTTLESSLGPALTT